MQLALIRGLVAPAVLVAAADGTVDSTERHETAICKTLRIAMVERALGDDEHIVLVDPAMSLGISPTTYDAMVDVMSFLQRPA